MGRAYLAVCGVVVCAAIFASCGSNRDCSNGSFCNDPDGGDATLVEGGGTDTGLIFGDTGGGKDGGGCNVTCSGDLHNVIDCNNNVVLACPPDQGCANGACAPACDAAKANKSSVGCDYYAVPATDFTGETCFAVYVANTWGSPVTLTASWGSQNFTNL